MDFLKLIFRIVYLHWKNLSILLGFIGTIQTAQYLIEVIKNSANM